MAVFLYALLFAIVFSATTSEGAVSQWCVADPQAPDYFLQSALDWVCSSGGADCNSIQPNQACYEPQNLVAHASVAFNSYWQKYKKQGASCYFNSAAFVTENNPSKGNCVYNFIVSSPSSPATNPNFPVYNSSIPGGIPNVGFGPYFSIGTSLPSSSLSLAFLVSLSVATLMLT
ncbi:glucan endo-1,3-beta-glucosidase 3 isoform X2 [Cryptomeria japonica]|uniref:glucan endo-1,3-beta-glucosidase 3 isoform X2 n=1 Tax=Cryptomeria japonica TaxID=3369 RepID=UPI0025AC94F6|nr:glucan endo-1,3-beta-glucosidase 3 isoform X2 [Cryptomeria japonica]